MCWRRAASAERRPHTAKGRARVRHRDPWRSSPNTRLAGFVNLPLTGSVLQARHAFARHPCQCIRRGCPNRAVAVRSDRAHAARRGVSRAGGLGFFRARRRGSGAKTRHRHRAVRDHAAAARAAARVAAGSERVGFGRASGTVAARPARRRGGVRATGARSSHFDRASRPQAPVMAGEGRPSTTLRRGRQESRGWPGQARP